MNMQNGKELAGKTAVVFGASRNMGRAFAVALAQRGASVAVHHHSEGSAAEAATTARQVEAAGGRALIVKGDIADSAMVKDIFGQVKTAFGRVDIVINCVGAIVKKPFVDYTEEDFDRSFSTNTRGAFFIMQEAARNVEDNGRIISLTTSLLGAYTGYYGLYAGSKAPLEDFTRALSKEIGARGVTVNTVAPGPIDTPFFHGEETPESVAYLSGASVAGRLGKVEDVVPMVEFLASPASQWVTGQTLFVNGGFVTR